MAITLTTELQAVNSMLTAIGESPVNSLSDDLLVDVAIARDLLREINVKVQTAGWHFNTEEEYPLLREIDNTINLPGNTLRVDAKGYNHPNIDVVQRGLKLYDRRNRTYAFNETIKVDIILGFDFEETPEYFRQYILTRAARVFGVRMVGSSELEGFTMRDELDARAVLLEAEGDTADHTIFDNPDVGMTIIGR